MKLLGIYVVKVRYSCGAYACSAGGKRSTATTGAEQAARGLAEKLWGKGPHRVEFAGCMDWWRIEKHAHQFF